MKEWMLVSRKGAIKIVSIPGREIRCRKKNLIKNCRLMGFYLFQSRGKLVFHVVTLAERPRNLRK